MALQLEIVSEHREIVGDDAVREFREDGGTIGRSLHNDWILPDPDRYISAKHAAVDCRGGIYYLADLSSNGVYVNHENEPIGKGNTRRLFDGDTLHFGDFKIQVTIEGGEELDVGEPPERSLHHDNVPQFATQVSPLTDAQMLDEDEITGDDEFQEAVFGTPRKKKPKAAPAKKLDEVEILDVGVEQPSADQVFNEFLQGLKVDRADLHPSIDLKDVMYTAGQVLREYVKGTEELLASRANLKTTFKLDQTTVLPSKNNPLKLSQNTGDSIKQLLVGKEGGEYLGPRDAVREISRDLLAHQDAFIEAMTAAFADFSDRFEPDELVESFDRALDKKPMFKMLSEQKYWQLYKDIYPILTETGGGRFPQMLAEEFVRSYERYIADSGRSEFETTRKYEPMPEPANDEASQEDIDPEISAELEALPDPQ